jgi:peptidoglycan lytic transglycosylase
VNSSRRWLKAINLSSNSGKRFIVALYDFSPRSVIMPVVCALLLTPAQQSPPASPQLVPTVHPALSASASDLWLVPSENDRSARSRVPFDPLTGGVKKFQEGSYQAALPLFSTPSLEKTSLADYATYYKGLTQLRLGQVADARRTLDTVIERKVPGYVSVAAGFASGEAAELSGDYAGALAVYERLADQKAAVSEDLLSRLGRAALAAGDRAKAAQAFRRVYYEFPLTDAATAAGAQLASLQDQIARPDTKADLARAQALFVGRRFEDARAAFVALQGATEGDDRELVGLRIAECDFNLKRYAAARDGVQPYLDRASRKAEARFFYLSALRELHDEDRYISLTASLVSDFPDSSWSEEALNNLGTYYIFQNDDEAAKKAFKDLYEHFPTGPRAERAAWKYGWSAYIAGDYAETVRVFESASVGFPRSDYRPSFLYWAGRAHARLGEGSQSESRLQLVYTDYANSYYGRLAERQLARRGDAVSDRAAVRLASTTQAPLPEVKPIPTEPLIRLLLANEMYDDALAELRYAQRAWGNSARIDATMAWVYNRKGELRRAISLMRRTYPQFLTAGHELPAEILQVIFPLVYWDSIRKQSAAHDLDPYLMAALIAQESTFDAGVRSSANAWGLMQLVPSTGRKLARAVGLRGFTTASLTNPEINIRLGTLYFSDLVAKFGGTYYALASYNAGDSRVARWKGDRADLDEDEFIDDIPFPETQNYVKRILGTAEDYRRLYPDGATIPHTISTLTPAKATVAKKPASKKKAPAKKTTPTTKKKTPTKPSTSSTKSTSKK